MAGLVCAPSRQAGLPLDCTLPKTLYFFKWLPCLPFYRLPSLPLPSPNLPTFFSRATGKPHVPAFPTFLQQTGQTDALYFPDTYAHWDWLAHLNRAPPCPSSPPAKLSYRRNGGPNFPQGGPDMTPYEGG